MDILRMYNDYGVVHKTEGHKHTRPGWVNTECVHCTGNPGLHLGWNLSKEYFYCWRCGWHAPLKTIMLILNVGHVEAKELVNKYGINRTVVEVPEKRKKQLLMPTYLTDMQQQHKQYLKGRGFDPLKIEARWGVQGTGAHSKVEDSWYKHRLFIPYYWNGELVTFDTRDITNEAKEKYKACPVNRELKERKKILYGNQERWTGEGFCVEGVTDVWRLGWDAFATSGTAFTQAQVRLMAQAFRKVWIAYDAGELQAQKQARKLKSELRIRGCNAKVVRVPNGGDPASLTQKEANEWKRRIQANG